MKTASLRHRAAIAAVIPTLLVTAIVGGVSAASPDAGDDLDRAFIDMMVPHHEAAIAMAIAALARGEHREILRLAPEIIEAQELEIA